MAKTLRTSSAHEGNFVRFEIRDGHHRISCAVLDDALDALSGLTAPSSMLLRRRSFERFRSLINVAAELKLKTLPSGSLGPIVLSREDLRRVPPDSGTPSFGSSGRGLNRPASFNVDVSVSAVTGIGDTASLRPAAWCSEEGR